MKLERMLQQRCLHAAVVLLLLVTGGCVLSSTSSNSYSSVELPVSDWKIVNSSKYSLGLSCCTYVFDRCVFHPCSFILAYSVLAYSTLRYFRFPYLRFQSPRYWIGYIVPPPDAYFWKSLSLTAASWLRLKVRSKGWLSVKGLKVKD